MKKASATRLEEPSTWVKYRPKLCTSCMAGCCKLPVEVSLKDLVRIGLIDEFDLEENPKKLVRRVKKSSEIEHFSAKNSLFTLSRLANGDCIYLDAQIRNCTIYQNRPDTCRNHPRIGPRTGYCPYMAKSE